MQICKIERYIKILFEFKTNYQGVLENVLDDPNHIIIARKLYHRFSMNLKQIPFFLNSSSTLESITEVFLVPTPLSVLLPSPTILLIPEHSPLRTYSRQLQDSNSCLALTLVLNLIWILASLFRKMLIIGLPLISYPFPFISSLASYYILKAISQALLYPV